MRAHQQKGRIGLIIPVTAKPDNQSLFLATFGSDERDKPVFSLNAAVNIKQPAIPRWPLVNMVIRWSESRFIRQGVGKYVLGDSLSDSNPLAVHQVQSDKTDAFRWLDEHMVASLEAPDEAFDWIWMTTKRDWHLLQEAWPSRSAAWREACAYVLGSGPKDECVPLLRAAIQDECDDVAIQAICSLCDQIVRHNDYSLLDGKSLDRMTDFNQRGTFARIPEVQELLSREAHLTDNQ